MSEHLGSETPPEWLAERHEGWTFRRGLSGWWFAWEPGNPPSAAPDFMADNPQALSDEIIRAAWQTAKARSGT